MTVIWYFIFNIFIPKFLNLLIIIQKIVIILRGHYSILNINHIIIIFLL